MTTNVLTWVTRRAPALPKWRTVNQWRKLSKRRLAEDCWAATITCEESMEVCAEAWARVADLVDMLEGRRPVDPVMLAKLNQHREHVVGCRTGSCEHEYAALVRGGAALTTPGPQDEAPAASVAG